MRVVDLIIKKKQGYELTKDEIHYFHDPAGAECDHS